MQHPDKIPKSECPEIWIRLPKHKWSKSWLSVEGQVVLVTRNLYGHFLAWLLWNMHFEKVLLKYGWGKGPNCECSFVNREKGPFLSMNVDDIKLAGKTQNIAPMWKVLMKQIDLGQRTSFPDDVYLGCTQRKCQKKQGYCWTMTETCSKPRFLLISRKNNQFPRKRMQKILHGPRLVTWKVMQRSAWKDIANCPTKQLDSPTKLQLHALMIINSTKKKCNLLENCLNFAHRLLWHNDISSSCSSSWSKRYGEFTITKTQLLKFV